jgi:flagellar protein FlgJ
MREWLMDAKEIPAAPVILPYREPNRDSVANVKEKVEKEKKLKKACADFESLFIYHMFKTMRSTVPRSGTLNPLTGKDTYEMMMDQKVSEELSKKGGLGLQEMLFRQMKQDK